LYIRRSAISARQIQVSVRSSEVSTSVYLSLSISLSLFLSHSLYLSGVFTDQQTAGDSEDAQEDHSYIGLTIELRATRCYVRSSSRFSDSAPTVRRRHDSARSHETRSMLNDTVQSCSGDSTYHFRSGKVRFIRFIDPTTS